MALVVGVSALIAYLFWLPLQAVGLFSDDWLLAQMLVPGTRDSVDWSFVLHDFYGPWLGVPDVALYRPLVSLSLAADIARGGLLEPQVLHTSNLVIHALSSALLAFLAYCLAPNKSVGRRSLAALFAGALFALHPVVTESTAWIAARTASLCLLFVLAATSSWFLWLKKKKPAVLALSIGAAIAALLSKETALALPLYLLLVELLGQALGHLPRSSFYTLLRHQLAWLPLWLAYFGLRFLIFGNLVGDLLERKSTLLEAWLQSLGPKLELLFLPQASLGPLGAWLALGLASGATVAVIWRSAARVRVAFSAFLLILSALVVTVIGARLPVDAMNGNASRVLLVSLAILALFPILLCGPARPALSEQPVRARAAWRPALWGLAFVPLLTGWLLFSLARRRSYLAAAQEMRALIPALQQATRKSDSQAASAILATPSEFGGIPFLNSNAVFPLLSPPWTEPAQAIIGLNCVLHRLPDQPDLYLDAAPSRAVLETGGELLFWTEGKLVRLQRQPPAPATLQRHESGEWRLAKSVSPFAFEGLEVDVAPQEGPAARLSFVSVGGQKGAVSFAADVQRDVQKAEKGWTLSFDLSHSIPFAASAFSGGVRGFVLDGLSPDSIRAVRLRRRVEELQGASLAGRSFLIQQDGEMIAQDGQPLPHAPQGKAGTKLRAVLLATSVAWAFEVEPGAALRLPRHIVRGLVAFRRSDQLRYLWLYWEQRGALSSTRSRLSRWKYRLEADG